MHINGKEIVVRVPSGHRLEVTPLATFLSEKRTQNEGVLWGVRMNERFEFTLQPTPYCINSGQSPRAFSAAYININDGLIHSIMDFPAGDAIDRCVSVFSGVEDTTPYTGNFLMMPYGWFESVGIKEGDRFDKIYAANVLALDVNRTMFGRSEFIIEPITTSGGAADILEEWEDDPASEVAATRAAQAPVIATWNGQPMTHVDVTGREIGKTKDERYSLLVTAILDVNAPDDSIKDAEVLTALNTQRVEHFLPLFNEKYQALKPWEGILLGRFEQHTCAYHACGLGTKPASLAVLKANGTITHLLDIEGGSEIDWSTVADGHYLLITRKDWFDAYHIKPGDKLPIARAASKQEWPQLVAAATANQSRTEAALAKVPLKKQQEADFLRLAQDSNRLREAYHIEVKHAYANTRISGTHDSLPGFWARLLGNDGSNLSARAWQCSDRRYTVTIRPKRDIDYVDVVNNPNPITIDATWSLSHVVGGDTSAAGSTSRTLNLPLRRADKVSETFTFNCVNDLHTDHGQETASELSMALAGQSSFRVHQTNFNNPVKRDAVYAENSRQWNLLSQAIDAHNASVTARQGHQAGGTGNHPGYVEVHVDMTCGFVSCTRKGISASAINGTFDIKPDSYRVVFWGIGGAATGRVRITATFDSTTCVAEVNIVDGNDYDLNFTTSCGINYFQAR